MELQQANLSTGLLCHILLPLRLSLIFAVVLCCALSLLNAWWFSSTVLELLLFRVDSLVKERF